MDQPEMEVPAINLDELSEDCVFEIFDRLPTNYLYAIAETCTRFFDLTAIQYRRRHPEKFVCLSVIDNKIVLLPNENDVKLFGRKFLNMVIRGDGRNCRIEDELVRFILFNCSSNLQMLRFEDVMLQGVQLKAMAHMLHRIDTVVIERCGITDDIYDCFLIECHRLKRLIVSDSYTIMDPVRSKWLHMKYPLLESVQIASITMVSFHRDEWETFFRQNPQIKSFSCDHWYSTDSTDRPIKIIHQNAVNLQRLYISLRGIGHLYNTYKDLASLGQSKQFECLELQFTGAVGKQYLQVHAGILASFKYLHALHLTEMNLTKDDSAKFSSFSYVKRIHFWKTAFDTEFAENISKCLPNLEEIYCDLDTNNFTPFIRNTPKLAKIRLRNTEIGALNLGWGLFWLNDERMKVSNVCPITIFVKDIVTDNTEHTVISNGLITIKPMKQNKRMLLETRNTFCNV